MRAIRPANDRLTLRRVGGEPTTKVLLTFRRPAFAVLLVCGSIAAALGFVATGHLMFVIESPSMGEAAPVGSLVVTEHASLADLRIGDVATYQVQRGEDTRTHRVVGLSPGGFIAKGDLNAEPDAEIVRPSRLVGRVIAIIPAAGRVMRLAPWFLGGIALVILLTSPLPRGELRSALRLVGTSASVSGVVALGHALLAWDVLSQRSLPNALLLQFVSTGLLPVRLSPLEGPSLLLNPGATGVLHAPADAAGTVRVDAALGLPSWGWVVLVLVCLLPLLSVLVVGLPVKDEFVE